MPAIRSARPSANMISVAFCSMETARRGGEVMRRGRPQLISSTAACVPGGGAPVVPLEDTPPGLAQAVRATSRHPAIPMGMVFMFGDYT
ncbi:hypothetical protein GCM10018953_47930 [Streptosporangium nondiastaticum]